MNEHRIGNMLWCEDCLTTLEYLARGHRVPCILQVRERQLGYLARVAYAEAEKDRRVQDHYDLGRFVRGEIDHTEYEAALASRTRAGERAAHAFLEAWATSPQPTRKMQGGERG